MRAREFRGTAVNGARAPLVRQRTAAAPQGGAASVRAGWLAARGDLAGAGPVARFEPGAAAQEQSLLTLQRRYGNRHVTGVIEAARSVEDVRRDRDPAEAPGSAAEPAVVDESLRRAIDAERGRGRPLEPDARLQLEPALGDDFSDVRLHTDATADRLSRAVAAEAFTTGSDIFFRAGGYQPLSTAGRKLLAHELTHVVQQRGAAPTQELRVTDPGDPSERQAEEIAQEVSRFPAGAERHETVGPKLPDEALAVERPPPPRPGMHALTADDVRWLQRSAGNAAASRLLARRSQPVLARQPKISTATGRELDAEMGQRVVDELIRVNNSKTRSATSGVHYPEEYEKLVQKERKKQKGDEARTTWGTGRWEGYADTKHWQRTGEFSWEVKPGKDAAEAIRKWLEGPTIAECASVLVAIELDTIRAAVGDDGFNAMFPSKDEKTRLKLSNDFSKSSLAAFMRTDEGGAQDEPGAVGRRSVKKGERYYFSNHPKYLLKHPGGGAWQGLNAICIHDKPGKQRYSGFGVGKKNEPELLKELAKAYNQPRNERDYKWLVGKFAQDEFLAKAARDHASTEPPEETWESVYKRVFDKVPTEYHEGKGFADTIKTEDIVDAPEYTIKSFEPPYAETTRKGGFQSGSGKELDADKVERARPPPRNQ